MKRFRDYAIAFKGLKDGMHQFAYVLDSKFFALFETPIYSDGHVRVDVEMKKGNQMLIFDFQFSGKVATICDNCLEPIDVPVDCNGKLFVKFGEVYDEPSDDIVVLPHEEHEYNVAQIMYDLLVTSIPIRNLHPVNKKGQSMCNVDMINKLKEYLVEDVSDSTENRDEEMDPRWRELKKIIDKN